MGLPESTGVGNASVSQTEVTVTHLLLQERAWESQRDSADLSQANEYHGCNVTSMMKLRKDTNKNWAKKSFSLEEGEDTLYPENIS